MYCKDMLKNSKNFITWVKKYLKQQPIIFNFYIFRIRRVIRLFTVIRTAFQEFFRPFPVGSTSLGINKLLITKKESTYFGDGVATIRFSEHLDSQHFIDSYNGAWDKVDSIWLQQSKIDIRLRAHICTWAAQQVKHLDGDFLEFGTYYGILAMTMCRYISFEKLQKNFYLFDTWAPPSQHHPAYPENIYEKYSDDIYDRVAERFAKYDNVKFIRGIVPDSIDKVLIEKIAFIGIDMNGYLAERSVLDILYQKVVTGGIIYFDDYGWGGSPSKLRETVDDFFKDKPEELLHFPSGNSIIIKK
jgi:O-methyltransferase